MNEKMFNDFLIEKWQCIVCVLKAYVTNDLYFVYSCNEGIYDTKLKKLEK